MECNDDARRVLGAAGVAVTWVFGSRATGSARVDSDVDLAVLSSPDRPALTLLELVALAAALRGLVPWRTGHRGLRECPTAQSRWEDLRAAVAEMDRAYIAGIAARGLATAV